MKRLSVIDTHFACLELLKSDVEAFGAPWPARSLIDTRRSWLSYKRGESRKK